MLNYLWSGMILIGILFAAFSGKMPDITTAALDSSKEAVTLCITMMGVMSFWTGLMGIAEKSGILKTAIRPPFPSDPFPLSRTSKRSSGRKTNCSKHHCKCTRTWLGGNSGRS